MSTTEKKERKVFRELTSSKHSEAYTTARRANIPVTVVRGSTIYRESAAGEEAIGVVEAPVKIDQKVYELK